MNASRKKPLRFWQQTSYAALAEGIGKQFPPVKLALKVWADQKHPCYVVSFIKCGRTWLRVMLAAALKEHYQVDCSETELLNLLSRSRSRPGFRGVEMVHDDSAHWKTPGELTNDKSRYRFDRVVLIVRDPRDVVVSTFFEKSRRLKAYLHGELRDYPDCADRIQHYSGTISQYIREPIGGLDTILQFFRIWHDNLAVPRQCVVIRYEDLHSQPKAELENIWPLIGLKNIAESTVEAAVEYASFGHMRQLETSNSLNTAKLRAGKPGDEESFKTRRGIVGGYREYLNQDDLDYADERIKATLGDRFGYG